jgi:hypothetical protein
MSAERDDKAGGAEVDGTEVDSNEVDGTETFVLSICSQ